jgi:SAM-dependent methyltransferase
MAKRWTPENIAEAARAYQISCVLTAAADLDVFGALASAPLTAADLADQLRSEPRATAVLLDALVALGLLDKQANRYYVPPEVADTLTETGRHHLLALVRHQGNCLRRWSQLAQVVQRGGPADRAPSVRGAAADQAAFIGAMHELSDPMAGEVIDRLGPLSFQHLLDIGGASGTWTIEFLRRRPQARATLFDLSEIIPMARQRCAEAGLSARVTLVAGDFYQDELPPGADYAWLSAIAHQNSRPQNRDLFARIARALAPGGILAIRDIVMEESHTRPVAGALFAVNMLVGTPAGGTYSFNEYRDDLHAAGFTAVTLLHQDDAMNSLFQARKA